MKKSIIFFIGIFLISFISASFFGYNTLEDEAKFVSKFGDDVSGTYNFNGGWMNGGASIIDGDGYFQTGFFFNITSLNVTQQNLTILTDLVLDGFTQGSVLFTGSNSEITEDNSNLFWDDVNKILRTEKLAFNDANDNDTFDLFTFETYDSPALRVVRGSDGKGFKIYRQGTLKRINFGDEDGSIADMVLGAGGFSAQNFDAPGGAADFKFTGGAPETAFASSLVLRNFIAGNAAEAFDHSFKIQGAAFADDGGFNLVSFQENFNEVASITHGGGGYFAGDVGIGTDSPTALLHIKNAGANFAGGLELEDNNDGKAGFIAWEASKMFFATGTAADPNSATTRMVILEGGNVGIGTDSPDAILHSVAQGAAASEETALILGNIDFTSGMLTNLKWQSDTDGPSERDSAAIKVEQDDSDSAIMSFWLDEVGLQQRMTILNDGNVGIGTVTPQNKLNVIGSINQTNGNLTGNLIYGELWLHNGLTVDLATVMVYVNITELNSTWNNGFAYDGNGTLTAQVRGVYETQWHISYSGGANSEYDAGIGINGNIIGTINGNDMNKTHGHRTIGTGGQIGSMSGGGNLCIHDGNKITMMMSDERNPISDPTLVTMQLNLLRIGDC